MVTPLAALMGAPMTASLAEPMAVPMNFVSNVGSDGKLDGETPSQNIVWLLLELDDILVSASAAESIDLYCVDWDGLEILTCSEQKNKVTIKLMKLAKVSKRSLSRMLGK